VKIVYYSICLSLTALMGCGLFAPQPAPGQAASPSGVPTNADVCTAQINQMLVTYCQHPPDPLPPSYAESVRRGYEGLKKRCGEQELTPLLSCVTDLEAKYASLDPDAAKRRDAVRDKAKAILADAQFKAYIDRWMQALDKMKITCRRRKVSDSDRRECERAEQALADIEKELAAFLEGKGFDRRDFAELGLWPSDPNPYQR